MTFDDFYQTLSDKKPPQVNDYLLALWHDANGDWEQSHNIIQDIETKEAAHIHAYLHRKEGDVWNADYWYARAGLKRPTVSLDEELKNLVILFCK
jgi:hypothetical protein